VELVKLVKDAGERIDGVGLQGHFIVGSMTSQEDLESVMNSYVAAGVSEVAYTEFDVKFTSLPYDAKGLEQQAQDYTTVIKACLNVKACVGWTIWDWTDKYSVSSPLTLFFGPHKHITPLSIPGPFRPATES
jgi:endo-1,4-beta-xylanase